MQIFGCPQNWDASPGKHNLIEFAKQPAWRTQKHQSCFLDQVAECLHKSSSIGLALHMISPNDVSWGCGIVEGQCWQCI